MRWSISEGWSFGPFKCTVSKTGVNLSVGIPGARVGINSNGQGSLRVGKKGFAYAKRKKILPKVTDLLKSE